VWDEKGVTKFDSSPTVKVGLYGFSPSLVVAIAHAFGYMITGYRHGHGGPASITFSRDDSPAARNRAAWTEYYCRTTGAWFAGCWSPQHPPGSIRPEKAAAGRIAVYYYEKCQHLPYWLIPPA
jgi:hypothetical protein